MGEEPIRNGEGTEPRQEVMPFALVQGRQILPPQDLYIPPDALEIFLEAFEGPLDLLLYLIKRHNLDILDIPIAEITRQYMQYIDLMQELRLELAAEYLVMAAMLAEIKSRMLLPRPVGESEEEIDPRAELVRRLQEYERFRKAADGIDALPRMERDTWQVTVSGPDRTVVRVPPPVELRDILVSFQEVMHRAELYSHHHVALEPLSVRERMTDILERLDPEQFMAFGSLFTAQEGRRGAIVTLLAILELMKESLIEMVQTEVFGPIYVKAPQHVNESESTAG